MSNENTSVRQYSVKGPHSTHWDVRMFDKSEIHGLLKTGCIIAEGDKVSKYYNAIIDSQIKPKFKRKHAHYFKPVAGFREVDVYRVLRMFDVTDQAIGHAIKKLLVAGGRGAGKDVSRDIQEAIDTLTRQQELDTEDAAFKATIPFEGRPL